MINDSQDYDLLEDHECISVSSHETYSVKIDTGYESDDDNNGVDDDFAEIFADGTDDIYWII